MMQSLGCAEFASGGFIERYLAQKLTTEEQEAFEAHFLTCDRCQDSLRLGAGIRSALRTAPPRRLRRPVLIWGGGLGLAAAAGLAAVLLTTAKPAAEPLARLGELVQAPLYLGIPVRGGQPVAPDSLFDAAMQEYTGEQYGEAAEGLRAALAAGVDPAPAEFFLASSLLMTGKASEAASGYAKVIALGDTPYLVEAHFYRAKALLRLGQAAAALAELRQAAGLGGVIGGYARALGDSVERVAPR